MLVAQRLEHHRLIDAVHELRRKLAPGSFDRGTLNLVIERCVDFYGLRRESKSAIDQVRRLVSAQVRSQNNDALGKIDAAVVAQSQRRLVQDSQQQLPE